MTKKEYKVVVFQEGVIGTLLLGASLLPTEKIEQSLNEYGRKGWNMDFMVVEQRRLFFFWAREAAIVTLSRAIA
jgi:Domain of unknown function (DUF4177)